MPATILFLLTSFGNAKIEGSTSFEIRGDVPKPGAYQFEGKSLTLGQALNLAGFQAERLATNQDPYPYSVTLEVSGETRRLELADDAMLLLSMLLEDGTKINVHKLSFVDAEFMKLMKELADFDWEGSPDESLRQLAQISKRKSEIEKWEKVYAQRRWSQKLTEIIAQQEVTPDAAIAEFIQLQIRKLRQEGLGKKHPDVERLTKMLNELPADDGAPARSR